MNVIYEPRPRYVVETAETTFMFHEERPGDWCFRFAFESLTDANAAADRLAEDNPYVRVVDRAADKENNA